MEYERITADDVNVGDRIARARGHEFQEVVRIDEGPKARRFYFSYDPRAYRQRERGENIRPQRHAKLWREVS